VGAWRANIPEDASVKRARHFLVAFDAAGRYGAGGRSYAHELTEGITRALSHRTRLMMAAYDGDIKVLPAPPPQAGLVGRERMLTSLWGLDGGGTAEPGSLLNWCASFPAREPSVAFVISNGQRTERDLPAPKNGSHPRVFLLPVGGQGQSPGAGKLCASLGGALLEIPRGLAPEAAAQLALSNVSHPGFAEIDLQVDLPNATSGRILTSTGTSASAPITWVLHAKRRRELSGTISAASWRHRREQRFKTPEHANREDWFSETLEKRLAEKLILLMH
jgi:hypothetical protein